MAVEGNRQAAGRIDITEEDIGDGVTAFLAGIPGLEDGLAGLCFRLEAHGRAGEVHQNHFLSGGLQLTDQPALHGRKFDVRTVAAAESGQVDGHLLTLDGRRNAAGEDDDVYALQTSQDILFRAFDQAAAADDGEVRDALTQSIRQRNGPLGNRVVIAPLHFLVVRVRTDESDTCAGSERQDAVVL